jgi:hypothetical protein
MMKNAKEIIAAITTMTAEKLAWLVANDERKSVRDRAEARLRALAKEEQEILAEEDEQEQQPEVEYEVCEACGCVRCCCDAVDEPEPVELLQDAGLDEAEAEAVVAAGVEPANEDEAAAVVDVVAAAGQAVLVAAEAEDVTEPGAWEPEGEGVEIGSVEPGQMVRSKSGRLVIVVGPSEEAVTEDGRLFQRAGYRTVIDHVTEVGIVRGTGVSPSTPVWPLTEAEQAYEAAIAGAVERRVAGDKEKAAAREAEAQRRLERAGARKAEKQAARAEKVAEGGGEPGQSSAPARPRTSTPGVNKRALVVEAFLQPDGATVEEAAVYATEHGVDEKAAKAAAKDNWKRLVAGDLNAYLKPGDVFVELEGGRWALRKA